MIRSEGIAESLKHGRDPVFGGRAGWDALSVDQFKEGLLGQHSSYRAILDLMSPERGLSANQFELHTSQICRSQLVGSQYEKISGEQTWAALAREFTEARTEFGTATGSALAKNSEQSVAEPVLTVPVRVILAIFDRWQLDDNQAATLLGMSGPAFIRELRSGGQALSLRDVQDRARLLIQLYEGVFALFQDAQAEQKWIRVPQPLLKEKSVLDAMLEGSFLDLVRARSFVNDVNGR